MLAYCRGSQHVIEALQLNISNLAIEGFDQHLFFISLPNQGLAPSFRLSGLSGNQPPSPFNWQLWLVIIILLASQRRRRQRQKKKIILTRPNWNIIRGPKVVENDRFRSLIGSLNRNALRHLSHIFGHDFVPPPLLFFFLMEKISNWLATSLTWLSAADLRPTIPNLLST